MQNLDTLNRLNPAPQPASERIFWTSAGACWRRLAGDFHRSGFSFEWHDWERKEALDWAGSFHSNGIEICLNLEGTGWVETERGRTEFASRTAGFYAGAGELTAQRAGGQRHRFVSVEFSVPFLKRHVDPEAASLHPLIQRALAGRRREAGLPPSEVTPLGARHADLLRSLLRPPVAAGARALWYEGKALELAAEFFFANAEFERGTRADRLAEERVSRVVAILSENLAEPPSLERLGQMAACSPFYLSRTFSRRTGLTISQWLRRARLERAASLLSARKCNVTEAALEVGYSS